MKRLIFAIMALTVALMPMEGSNPKHEMRGAWLATIFGIDWPGQAGVTPAITTAQQRELTAMIDALADAGFNTVMFQVRPMADALYRTNKEPWSSSLTGTRGVAATYDPLEFAISKCHARGMECHAWLNPYRVGQTPPETKLDKQYSHLWMTNAVGKNKMTIFNPAYEETRQHISDITCDIARRYDVDGIVFDDYFYLPEFIPEDESAADWKAYQDSGSDLPMADWRRANINEMIRLVSSDLSRIKEGKIRFGLSPQGIGGGNGAHADEGVPSPTDYGVITADSQYGKIYSDPVQWLIEGTIDYISPQIYWMTDNPKHPYGGLTRWWNDVAEMFGRHCFPSIRIANFAKDNTPEAWSEADAQIEANREASFNNAPGVVAFSASHISGPRSKGFGRHLSEGLFSTLAILPPMGWKEADPQEISNLRLSGDMLVWEPASDCRYIVYAIPIDVDPLDAICETGDGFAPEYILGITYSNSFRIGSETINGCRLAVAPYDRYGNEWNPLFLQQEMMPKPSLTH